MPNERTLELEHQIGDLKDQGAFLDRIAKAGQRAVAVLQGEVQSETSEVASQVLAARTALDSRVVSLTQHATTAANWDQQDLALFAAELSGLTEAFEVIIIDMPAGGSGATSCRETYDACINNECGPGGHGTVCLCCVPCSLEYMGCMAKLWRGLIHQAQGPEAGDPSKLQNAPEG